MSIFIVSFVTLQDGLFLSEKSFKWRKMTYFLT